MKREELSLMLDKMWAEAGKSDKNKSDPEIDSLVDNNMMSIRYAVLTQVLGKLEDPNRDILSMQSSGNGAVNEAGFVSWNARTFCQSVVVPWVLSTRNIIGNSGDPYVSNPLRRPRLDDYANINNAEEWKKLAEFLEKINRVEDAKLVDVLRRILEGIYRMGVRNAIKYKIPENITLDGLCGMIDSLIQDKSRGYRPQAVCAVLMRTAGRVFGIFDNVEVQGVNVPDSQSGMYGDITCKKGELIRLVIEVKDREIGIIDLKQGMEKIRGSEVHNLLFTAPGIRKVDEHGIKAFIIKTMKEENISIYRTDIISLARSVFTLADSEARLLFIRDLGTELDENGQYEDRARWADLCDSY